MGRGAALCGAPPHVRALRTALGAGFRIRLRRKVPYVFSQKTFLCLLVFAHVCKSSGKEKEREGPLRIRVILFYLTGIRPLFCGSEPNQNEGCHF